jgi:hypothetical protein
MPVSPKRRSIYEEIMRLYAAGHSVAIAEAFAADAIHRGDLPRGSSLIL